MQAGKLRHRITIEHKTTTPDEMNQPIATWAPLVTLWAEVKPLSGRELVAAKEQQATAAHQVTIRYRAGIDSAMRVKYGARSFNILAVVDVEERHREMQLLCEEVVGREAD